MEHRGAVFNLRDRFPPATEALGARGDHQSARKIEEI
jgi:hypothetical protein